MKQSLRPTSVLQLALIAFALVGLPLIFALVTATLAVDRLASQSRQSVRQAIQIIDAGRALVEELTGMERNARQYQLLGDAELLESYLRRRDNFLRSVEILKQHEFSVEYRRDLAALEAEEQQVFATLGSQSPGSQEAGAAVARFPVLADGARRILADGSREIGHEAEQMRLQAANTQQRLLWQALAVIPAALVLAVIGTVLITRPIRQVERAIRRLGSGHFDAPVEVRGPRDLEELGARLDWLRVRLLDLDAQKIRFLRDVSHELKTPLTAIREGAQLLSDHVVGELTPAQEEVADILCKSSIQLQRRIEDLLNFNTIVQGLGAPALKEPVELKKLIDHVLAEQLVSVKGKDLQIDIDAAALIIPGDQERLRIVLDNLLSNAIKYSPAGGRIQVRLRSREGQAVIEIQDEGPGIVPEERTKVFDPFYQGSAVYDGHVKGTGLGLAITHEYVRAHEGTIEVADIPNGACLQVKLPLAEERSVEEATTTS